MSRIELEIEKRIEEKLRELERLVDRAKKEIKVVVEQFRETADKVERILNELSQSTTLYAELIELKDEAGFYSHPFVEVKLETFDNRVTLTRATNYSGAREVRYTKLSGKKYFLAVLLLEKNEKERLGGEI